MDESTAPNDPAGPTDGPAHLTGTDAASAPPRRGFTLRGRKWVYGATLAAAGVLAGSGVTYAVVADSPGSQVQAAQQDGGQRGPGGRGALGAPPDGQAPDGQALGAQSSTDSSGSTGTTT